MKLPQLSIATKLYAIFALLATMTVGLAAVAVVNAYRHAALTDEFESAYAGGMNVERVNALIYAVVMESRGIYMSSDIPTAKVYGDGLLVFNDRIGEVMKEWRGAVRAEDAALFGAFAKRIQQFQDFRRELVRRGTEIDPAAGREWGDNDANRSVRKALNKDIEDLAEHLRQPFAPDLFQDRARDRPAGLAPELAGGVGRSACRRRRRHHLGCGRAPAGADHRRHRRRRRRPIAGHGALWRARRRNRRAGALDRGVPGHHAPERGTEPRGRRRCAIAGAPPGMDGGGNHPLRRRRGSDLGRTRPHFRSDAGGLDPGRGRGRQGSDPNHGRGHGFRGRFRQCAGHRVGRRRARHLGDSRSTGKWRSRTRSPPRR